MARTEMENKDRSAKKPYDWDKHEAVIFEMEKELKKISIPKVNALNVSEYQKMLRAAAILELYTMEDPECGKIEIKVFPERQIGKIFFECSELSTLPIWLLHELAKDADKCIETKLCGGRRRLCVSFRRLFISE